MNELCAKKQNTSTFHSLCIRVIVRRYDRRFTSIILLKKKQEAPGLAFISLFVSAQMMESKPLCSFFPLQIRLRLYASWCSPFVPEIHTQLVRPVVLGLNTVVPYTINQKLVKFLHHMSMHLKFESAWRRLSSSDSALDAVATLAQ